MISCNFLLVLINLQHWFVSILQQVTGEPFSLEAESNCKVSRIECGCNSETTSSDSELSI